METEHNLKMEMLTIAEIGTAWKCEPVKLPQYCQLDFALTREGKIEAFAEVKCRTFPRDRFKTSLIHLHKMMYARQVAFETGIPTFLIVRWTDWIGACSFKVDFHTTVGGRRDRGIERDYGLMAEVPIDEFHMVRELNETI